MDIAEGVDRRLMIGGGPGLLRGEEAFDEVGRTRHELVVVEVREFGVEDIGVPADDSHGSPAEIECGGCMGLQWNRDHGVARCCAAGRTGAMTASPRQRWAARVERATRRGFRHGNPQLFRVRSSADVSSPATAPLICSKTFFCRCGAPSFLGREEKRTRVQACSGNGGIGLAMRSEPALGTCTGERDHG